MGKKELLKIKNRRETVLSEIMDKHSENSAVRGFINYAPKAILFFVYPPCIENIIQGSPSKVKEVISDE